MCSDGNLLDEDGYCHESCSVIGCEECSSSSSETCVNCVDDYWTNIINGECDCWWSSLEKPNSRGICNNCYAVGCASCLAGSSYYCHICEDEANTLSGYQCYCPDGQIFNEDGECHTCNVVGCNKCSSSSPDVCTECIDDYWTNIVGGQCDCWWSSS